MWKSFGTEFELKTEVRKFRSYSGPGRIQNHSAYHDKKLTNLSVRNQIYCNDVSANRIEQDLNDREDKIWKGSQ